MKFAFNRKLVTPINRVSVIARFKIRQGQWCRKLLLSSWTRLALGTFPNFLVLLYPIILQRASRRSFRVTLYAVKRTFRRIGNKSKAFLEKLPINSRVSSVRWALRCEHPSILKFPNSQQKGVMPGASRPYDVSQVSWQTRKLFALESIPRAMISSIRHSFTPDNFYFSVSYRCEKNNRGHFCDNYKKCKSFL